MPTSKPESFPTVREGAGSTVREAMKDRYPEPGSVIDGSYRVIETIGEGGMGVVLKVRDVSLDRVVALKLIHPDQVLQMHARRRFLEEARAMARVRHRNVVQIHAFGDIDGAPYFVMEYVEGCDLERWLAQRGGRPSLGEAWTILDQACRGVQAMHDTGTAHRDLKSSNVLIGPDFRVAITDLGLARVVEEQSSESMVSGTPAYMAPELITGAKIPADMVPRLDVYSLGVIAFELLTGTLPFDSDDVSETLRLQVKAPPPRLISRRDDLPREFEEVVLRALEKDPAIRTPSAEALRAGLEAAWLAHRRPTEALFFLVADDDEGFRSLVRSTLDKAFPEARVESVPDGRAALALAQGTTPHLIVTDLDMPEMNGVELTAALRADRRTMDVPILVMSAVGGARDWQVLSQLGADWLAMKPLDPFQFVALVENLLGREATWKPKPKRRPSSAG